MWHLHHADTSDGPDPDTCGHAWRLRDVSVALPGPYVCEVCDCCGMLRIHGPEEITGPVTHVAVGAAIHLESLARRSAPPSSIYGPLPAAHVRRP